MYDFVGRRGPKQFYMKIGRDGAIRLVLPVALHDEIRCGPVGVAVEQGPDDAAVEHPGERLMVRFSPPFRYDLVALRKTLDVQSFIVRGATAETDAVRGIALLKRQFFFH